ncbi:MULTISPECIES: excalibur calcium-binding domain-containing protein [unclassified Nocardioides]|uniref:excalibur calcium-binding domain-containing protein n=1 Tax=unclassified Nocardioides TaxID=2615069 RepID=UPI0006FA7CDB|nr:MULTISPECIES: excalibur calcium-binding domain-containing protein [unclassified Nocardioides]KRA32386.1 hypothetical protein ASD81_12475 [Nocardioides sp. Root614]KRA89039.1 hypothetical protein ASD84_12740 [Nocardioides sp. Root682]
MNRRFAAALAAVALSMPVTVALAPAADAAGTYYSSCTKLAKVYPHGVAKSATAAARQVRAGYGRPSTTTRAKKVYWANYKRLDRDRDGTACER